MTRYEVGVENGLIVPMNGLDWLMLQGCVESLLKNEDDEELKDVLKDMEIEIEHFYADDSETLLNVKNILQI